MPRDRTEPESPATPRARTVEVRRRDGTYAPKAVAVKGNFRRLEIAVSAKNRPRISAPMAAVPLHSTVRTLPVPKKYGIRPRQLKCSPFRCSPRALTLIAGFTLY